MKCVCGEEYAGGNSVCYHSKEKSREVKEVFWCVRRDDEWLKRDDRDGEYYFDVGRDGRRMFYTQTSAYAHRFEFGNKLTDTRVVKVTCYEVKK